MFTGIIETTGTIRELISQGEGARLRVAGPAEVLGTLKRGDSIAVNGCCLTAVELGQTGSEAGSGDGGEAWFLADLAPETIRCTAYRRLRLGDRVNLERPLRAGDLLSGHLVQGHVEGTADLLSFAAVDAQAPEAGFWMRLRLPQDLLPYVVWKGSLTVEGVSLTVAALDGDTAGFAIIPFTARHTNLGALAAGAPVNIETDPIGRHLERLLETRFAGAAKAAKHAWSEVEFREQGF